MSKISVLLLVLIGVAFADSSDKSFDTVEYNHEYLITDDYNNDDFKTEARRRGKGHKGRKRGGGLR